MSFVNMLDTKVPKFNVCIEHTNERARCLRSSASAELFTSEILAEN